jgi:hypothetical protein
MIKIRVFFDRDEERDLALLIHDEISSKVVEDNYYHTHTINDPINSFGINIYSVVRKQVE